MQYVSSVERIGIAKGESRLLRKQLEHRFGVLPMWVSDKLNNADELELEHWGEAVLSEPTLDAVFNDDTTH